MPVILYPLKKVIREEKLSGALERTEKSLQLKAQ